MSKAARVAKKAVRAASRAFRPTQKITKQVVDSLDVHAISAMQMLADPCNAALAPGCYRGDQGFRTRLVRNLVLGNGAGITSVAIAFVPGNGTVWVNPSAAPSTLTAWTNLGVIGGTYLTTNASSMRSLGACCSSTPNAANLSVSGQIYTNIVPASSANLLATNSIDNLTALCSTYGKVTIDAPMETKFVPAAADEQYNVPGQVADLEDTNIILQVFTGLPAATGVTTRFTDIVEWKPLNGLSLVTESFLGNPSRNTIEHVKEALRKKNPKWFTNIGALAYSVIRGYATGGSVGAIGAAAKGISNFM